MSCEIKLSKIAQEQLDKLDNSIKKRILKHFKKVENSSDSFAAGKYLRGNMAGFKRYHIGGYRVIVEEDKPNNTINIIYIDKRDKVYGNDIKKERSCKDNMIKINESLQSEYIDITSMDNDRTKFAYDLIITKETRDSIYTDSSYYDWSYRVEKSTGAVYRYKNGKSTKIADTSTYTLY